MLDANELRERIDQCRPGVSSLPSVKSILHVVETDVSITEWREFLVWFRTEFFLGNVDLPDDVADIIDRALAVCAGEVSVDA